MSCSDSGCPACLPENAVKWYHSYLCHWVDLLVENAERTKEPYQLIARFRDGVENGMERTLGHLKDRSFEVLASINPPITTERTG